MCLIRTSVVLNDRKDYSMKDKDSENTLTITIQASRYENGQVFRKCPKCKEEKDFVEFGFRDMGKQQKEIREQSYCKVCRQNYSALDI